MLNLVKFKVENFRNIDNSDWIKLDRVTAFVGRNESGKTALLKALHKFNPATPEPYIPQREFPRDRFTRDFVEDCSWPVCSTVFELDNDTRAQIGEIVDSRHIPQEVTCTRYYDGTLEFEYHPEPPDPPVSARTLVDKLAGFARKARRIKEKSPETEEETKKLRSELADWAQSWKDQLTGISDLRSEDGKNILLALRREANAKSNNISADLIDDLQEAIDPLVLESQTQSSMNRINEIIESNLPVFIYFENYGILDSAIYLPRFLDELRQTPSDARVRTINAMFQHVRLSPSEISELGREKAEAARQHNHMPSEDVIYDDEEKKEKRAILLNSASLDISKRFSEWWQQRRHKIRYHADGAYFRIWISDNRRPDVEIELEARSKGFQWFFSFYLVFLVESNLGHKDAVLLLDEPGLHLHPTAQEELISFFESLSENNQIVYTTHSPFLIDGDHLYRVRPVTEDESGHSRVAADTWPKDRETIFPLQAAAGYAMLQGLFRNRKNILVEGMSDYYYLDALSHQCRLSNRSALPDDIYITPCGGTKNVGYIASLFLGQKVRPLVLLDSDDAGKARGNALLKELYSGHESSVLMLSEVLGKDDCEIEDLVGETTFLSAINDVLGASLSLTEKERKEGSLVDRAKAAAVRQGVPLPEGWKVTVAIQVVRKWAESDPEIPSDVLDRAAALFETIGRRFD